MTSTFTDSIVTRQATSFRVLLAGLGAATLSACAGADQAPTSPPGWTASASSSPSARMSAGSGATLAPNSVKYADAGWKPSRGRSSKGQEVWSRALLGRDGSATLEISTAEFESGAPPVGVVDQVHLKLLAPDGTRSRWNVTDAPDNRGDVTLDLGHPPRNTVVDAQANVDDATGQRTDIVVTQAVVKLRPDLRVLPLTVPALVQVNVPFDIAATVRETNGDVGARADCVLAIDGADVDRVANMWVDAGSSVSCLFRAPAMHVPGSHAVAVRVERVAPADFDVRNNAASTTFMALVPSTGTIVPGVPVDHFALDYSATVFQRVGHSTSTQTTYYAADNGGRSDTHLDIDADHAEQQSSFMAWTNRAIRPPLTTPVVDGVTTVAASVAFTESTSGAALEHLALPSIPLTLNYGSLLGAGGGCWVSGPRVSGAVLSLCTFWDAAGVGQTVAQYTTFSTSAQYISRAYLNQYDAAGTLTSTVDAPTGWYMVSGRPFAPYGTSVTYDLLLDAGNFTFAAHPTIALSAVPYAAETGPICSSPSAVAGGTEWVCNTFSDNGTITTGFAATGDPNALP